MKLFGSPARMFPRASLWLSTGLSVGKESRKKEGKRGRKKRDRARKEPVRGTSAKKWE